MNKKMLTDMVKEKKKVVLSLLIEKTTNY